MNTTELLIANGQLVADTLRHLADNEIDSDYFAITSTSENGTEIEHELVITDYALQAASTVEALVEALESALRANASQNDHINQQQDRIDQLEKGHSEAARHIHSWRRLANQNIAEREKDIAALTDARRRIAELEARTVTVTLPAHKYRECVNGLLEEAIAYAGTQQLRERLSSRLANFVQPAHPHTRCPASIKCEVKGGDQ